MEGDKSPRLSTTVMTFYNDLADEVDQHFSRALHSANTTKKASNHDETRFHDFGKNKGTQHIIQFVTSNIMS